MDGETIEDKRVGSFLFLCQHLLDDRYDDEEKVFQIGVYNENISGTFSSAFFPYKLF